MTGPVGYSCVCQTPDCGALFVVTTRALQGRRHFCSTACGARGRKMLRVQAATVKPECPSAPGFAALDPIWIGNLV